MFYYSRNLKFYVLQYINCEGKVSTSVFLSMHVIVKSTRWWPKMAETCSRRGQLVV